MRIPLPSFRVQIFLLVAGISLVVSLLMREFFLLNLEGYQEQISEMTTEQRVRDLHRETSAVLDSLEQEHFNREIEGILRDLNKLDIAGEFYKRDIKLYSVGIVIVMMLLTGGLFLFLFILITRPLARLLQATDLLGQGDFQVSVKESQYSPLNTLIVAFNRMVDELNQSRERLIEAERQTIWQEMARAMAHEIKNPLTPIRLAAQRLEAKHYERAENLPEVLEKTLRVINEEVDNLQNLVTAFSGFAKMPEAKPITYDLNKQLASIAEQYSDDAQLEVQLDPALSTIHADTMQIKQVLVNLIQNAIQASDDPAWVGLRSRVEAELCHIEIEDRGQGISAEGLEKIFEPYYTTKKKGTGLGLAITRRIIRQHGGDINVHSVQGEGSIFTITLPCGISEQSTEEKA